MTGAAVKSSAIICPKTVRRYDAQQDTFLTIPRPTDADADASGRLFVTSWKNGGFAFERPDVGFVAMITPSNFVAHPVSVPSASGWASALRANSLSELDAESLVQLLQSPSDTLRLASGRALALRANIHLGISEGSDIQIAARRMSISWYSRRITLLL